MSARVVRRPAPEPLQTDPPDRAAYAYHRRLPGYEPTPLVDARGLAADLDVARLWVKDESRRLGLPSFKILGASWGVYRSLERAFGPLEPWHTFDELSATLSGDRPVALAAATDGNHGKAVARMARLFGFDARIFVPTGTAPARIAAIEAEGAFCVIVEGTYDDAVARSAEEASARCLVISDTSWSGYEDVPGWVIDGYSTIFWEIDEDLDRRGGAGPDIVLVQIGVGALAAAAARHYRRPGASPRPALVGVEPEGAACMLASVEAGGVTTVPGPHSSIMAGLNCGTPSIVAWPIVSRAFELFMAIEDERARQGMRALAGEGLVSGETGAAGVGALLEIASRPDLKEVLGIDRATRVLVLSTEGATDPASYERIVGTTP